jgi:hypothetical protein
LRWSASKSGVQILEGFTRNFNGNDLAGVEDGANSFWGSRRTVRRLLLTGHECGDQRPCKLPNGKIAQPDDVSSEYERFLR